MITARAPPERVTANAVYLPVWESGHPKKPTDPERRYTLDQRRKRRVRSGRITDIDIYLSGNTLGADSAWSRSFAFAA
jgi:hypothetical protein